MEIALIVVNVIAGALGAYMLARRFRIVEGEKGNIQRQFGILISIYFAECVSVVLGMGMPVFSIFLSFIWAAIFGMRLSKWDSRAEIRKGSFLVSLYTSLPVISFIIVPVVVIAGGGNVASVEAGHRFGIPQFPFIPSPMRTILGFYTAVILGAFTLKTLITMGGIALVGRKGREAA